MRARELSAESPSSFSYMQKVVHEPNKLIWALCMKPVPRLDHVRSAFFGPWEEVPHRRLILAHDVGRLPSGNKAGRQGRWRRGQVVREPSHVAAVGGIAQRSQVAPPRLLLRLEILQEKGSHAGIRNASVTKSRVSSLTVAHHLLRHRMHGIDDREIGLPELVRGVVGDRCNVHDQQLRNTRRRQECGSHGNFPTQRMTAKHGTLGFNCIQETEQIACHRLNRAVLVPEGGPVVAQVWQHHRAVLAQPARERSKIRG
eukprot:scaffold7079_cov128-Isochrysis_galbana.AAC.9